MAQKIMQVISYFAANKALVCSSSWKTAKKMKATEAIKPPTRYIPRSW